MKKYIGIIPLFLTFLASLVLWIFTQEGMIFFPFWILPLMAIIIWGIFVAIKTISRGEYKKNLTRKNKTWSCRFEYRPNLILYLNTFPYV